jgi:hypothetical protein
MSPSHANVHSVNIFLPIYSAPERRHPLLPAVLVVRRVAGTPGFLRRRRWRSVIISCKNSKNSGASVRAKGGCGNPVGGPCRPRASISRAIGTFPGSGLGSRQATCRRHPRLPEANSPSSLAQIKGPPREPSIAKSPAHLLDRTLLANRRIDLIVRSAAGIQQTGGRVARRSRKATRRCAEEPAIIRVRAKRVAVSLGRHRRLPGAGSA